VLVVDPGQHTAPIIRADVDMAGRFAVTASHDRTVRVWSVESGTLLRTIRLPAGPGNVGKAYAVAIDPAAELIAAGGWTDPPAQMSIYLYARADSALLHRIDGLSDVVLHLAFAPDGGHLVAMLGGANGIRVFARAAGWAEVARDADYGDQSYGAAFAPDGRLATTSWDGQLRLYSADFRLLTSVPAPGGRNPFGVAFNAEGTRLAVGDTDSTRVDILDGHNLRPLHQADSRGIDNGNLHAVAWMGDDTLLAAGSFDRGGMCSVLAWGEQGHSARRLRPAGYDTVMSLLPLPGGNLLVAAQDPWFGLLASGGHARWAVPSPLADYRNQGRSFAVSFDGSVVDFGYEPRGRGPARFDVSCFALASAPAADQATAPARRDGFAVANWLDSERPTLDGRPLHLGPNETSRSLAVHPDGNRLVLGTEWRLCAFDAQGAPLWQQVVPSLVWAVNITGDGRLAVAAYGDGTIRWHRMDDGREILAFMPLADRTNWVAWTPEGFYAASPGAHGVLRWHVNQPDFQPAGSLAVADIPGFYRPAVIPLVLQELETARAIGIATIAEQRRKVQLAANSRLPPGAKLHLLAVGVSRFNDRHGAHLRLQFAHKDAHDVASALSGTQDALYVPGSRQYLPDEDATRAGMLRALDALRGAMGQNDLAVVHFAGHGAMVDGALYLLPHEVDARDAVAIRATALPITQLREELLKIAERGRVLVLLDACYSGAASADGRAEPVASARLTQALAAANISVLTSSSASETSREDAAWQNGAFTKAVLEALGPDADTDHDGLISVDELAAYIHRRVPALTGGRQTPAREIRFGGTLFAVR
jgi:hypothetical protein